MEEIYLLEINNILLIFFHSSEWKKMEDDKEKLEKNIQLFESLLLKEENRHDGLLIKGLSEAKKRSKKIKLKRDGGF